MELASSLRHPGSVLFVDSARVFWSCLAPGAARRGALQQRRSKSPSLLSQLLCSPGVVAYSMTVYTDRLGALLAQAECSKAGFLQAAPALERRGKPCLADPSEDFCLKRAMSDLI